MKQLWNIFLIVATLSIACRQVYAPPVVRNPPSDLVIEGFVESNGTDSSWFVLSRSIPLADSAKYTPESGAKITIEDSTGKSYLLTEIKAGTYIYPAFPFPNNTSYRLHILSSNRDEYLSDYTPLVVNPPIDSISWQRSDDPIHLGVTLFANTHDPQNNTRYYRWSTIETYKFHSKYSQVLAYVNGRVVPGSDTLYYCWRTDTSTSIELASSTQLSQAVIYQQPILLVPLNGQKIQVRYSALVKQYGLTKDAFAWWQILKKNTEQIGSIFGVQPSANLGNYHCINDTSQFVIGYFGGGNTQTKRIFIDNSQVQPWNYVDDCPFDSVGLYDLPKYYAAGYLLYNYQNILYRVAHNYCVDCTLTGSNKQPAFWQ